MQSPRSCLSRHPSECSEVTSSCSNSWSRKEEEEQQQEESLLKAEGEEEEEEEEESLFKADAVN